MAVLLQWQLVGTVGEFGDFDNCQGGQLNAPPTDYVPAGKRIAQKLQGTMSVTDITTSRAYDPVRDKALVDYVNNYFRGINLQGRPITIKEKDAQGIVIGTRDYAICKPTNLTLPDGQAGSNALAMISVTWAVESLV